MEAQFIENTYVGKELYFKDMKAGSFYQIIKILNPRDWVSSVLYKYCTLINGRYFLLFCPDPYIYEDHNPRLLSLSLRKLEEAECFTIKFSN